MGEWIHAPEVEAIAETLIDIVDRHADLRPDLLADAYHAYHGGD